MKRSRVRFSQAALGNPQVRDNPTWGFSRFWGLPRCATFCQVIPPVPEHIRNAQVAALHWTVILIAEEREDRPAQPEMSCIGCRHVALGG